MIRIPPRFSKIAVLRANAVGDYVMALPALEALHETWPRAEIVLLGQRWHRDFLVSRPGPVHRVEVLPHVRGLHEATGADPDVDAFVARMRAERFDLVVQLHGGGATSNPFCRRLGGGLTIGMRAPDAPPLDIAIPYATPMHSEVLRLLEVVEQVGARTRHVFPRLSVTPRDVREAMAYLPQRPFVLLNPGARDPRRRWPVERFAELAGRLPDGLDVIAHLGPGEDALAPALRAAGVRLVRGLSLCGLLGLVDRAALVVSNDTGTLHLARAVGVPNVGLHWIGNCISYGPTRSAIDRALVSWQLDCAVCGMSCLEGRCPHDPSFVDAITLEAVADSARDLLAQPARAARAS